MIKHDIPIVVFLPRPFVYFSLFHPGGLAFLSIALEHLAMQKHEAIPMLKRHLRQWREKKQIAEEQEARGEEETVTMKEPPVEDQKLDLLSFRSGSTMT